MKITLELLEQNGACEDQRRLFAATFPNGANVNARNLSKARKAELDVLWLGRLLPQDRKSEYNKVCGAARAECDKVCGPARAEYNKVCGAALVRAFEGL